eukprot:TRINITY_DN287_c0_g1_i1.p1 TRINITY_DN287_c0_g1~~TRINITY_DN287_c0_g1_i1.p1  ORF type:complete len:412 (-),score=146.16 TRINITY_DN287_c0_g1_i1:25-1260(-)
MSDSEASDVEEVAEELLTDDDIMSKYRTAGDIANLALSKVVAELADGKKIADICIAADKFILEQTSKSFKAAKIEKGVAFPTSLSVNHIVGHFSPEADDKTTLATGNVVKVDLGVHIDGFIATVGHTHVVGADVSRATTGRQADVICAAHIAAEAVLHMLKPGIKNKDITAVIKQVADTFHVNPVEGVLSHQMKKYLIDGTKVIMNKSTPEQQAHDFDIEPNDVFSIDIVMSTGDGKPKESDVKPTIYKRVVDQAYSLKLAASRKIFGEIKTKYPALPFNIRALEDKHVRFGLTECETHGLINAFPVVQERDGEYVAQFKYTALVGTAGAVKLTGHALPLVSSQYAIDNPELKTLLASSISFNKKKSKNKNKKRKIDATPSSSSSSSSTTSTSTTTTTTKKKDEATPMDTN